MDEQNSHSPIALKAGRPAQLAGINASLFLQEQSALSKYSSLPWELRHHIHTFCVQGFYDNEVVVRRGIGSDPNLLVRQSTGPHSYQWVKDPIFQQLRPNRIGVAAAKELLETYYKTRTFKFIHDELSTLQLFLENDTFSLAMRPADHVRRLHLQIQPFRYARLQETSAMSQEQRTCREALQSLCELHSPRTAIELHVDLAQGFCDDEEYDELLDNAARFVIGIFGLVHSFREKGLGIEVIIDGRWDGKDGTRSQWKELAPVFEILSRPSDPAALQDSSSSSNYQLPEHQMLSFKQPGGNDPWPCPSE